MAKLSAKTEVSVEKVVHNSLRETIQMLHDDHGLLVNGVSVDWIDLSQIGDIQFKISSLRIDTETFNLI